MYRFKFKGGIWKTEEGIEKFLLFIPRKENPAVLLYSMIQMGLVVKKDDWYKTTNDVLQLILIKEFTNRPNISYTMFIKLLLEDANHLTIYPIDQESGFELEILHGGFLTYREALPWSILSKETLLSRMSIPVPLLERIVEVKERGRRLRI